MRDRSRAWAALTLAAGATLVAAADPPDGEVSLTVSGLRSHKGQVLVCMTRAPKDFPDCRADVAAFTAVLPAGPPVQITFSHVPAGRYAIAVLHDENGNGRPDRAFGVIPIEGFGFSRDAPARMGPPRFADAAFAVSGDDITQPIRMRYLM